MKTVLFVAALVAVSAVTASAMSTVEDADGNGTYSMEEMLVSFPDMTAETFAEIDADGSGEVSEDELTSAAEAGLLGE